jgi:hypothetical protein
MRKFSNTLLYKTHILQYVPHNILCLESDILLGDSPVAFISSFSQIARLYPPFYLSLYVLIEMQIVKNFEFNSVVL